MLVRIAFFSPNRSRGGLHSREINEKNLISSLTSLGLDPSRIRLFVPMEFFHDGVFFFPVVYKFHREKSKIFYTVSYISSSAFYPPVGTVWWQSGESLLAIRTSAPHCYHPHFCDSPILLSPSYNLRLSTHRIAIVKGHCPVNTTERDEL